MGDASGNANAGSYRNGVILGGSGGVSGDTDTSASFDGATTYASAPSSTSLNAMTSAITLEALVKPTAASIYSQKPILVKGYTSHDPPYYQYALFLSTSSTVAFDLSIGGSFVSFAVSNAGWTAGVWNHIAATYDGSTMRIYVNGTLVGSRAQTGTIGTYATPVDIAAYENLPKMSAYNYGGSIDEVAIYSSALSSTKIQNHAGAALGTGSSCADISGATAASYNPTVTDTGATLRVTVTATNADGPTTASSSVTAPVGPSIAPANTIVPVVSGTSSAGSTLSVTNGSWDNGVSSYAYQWRRCDTAGLNCQDVTAATATTYQLQAADIGSTLRGAVIATNAAGSTTASSAATSTVAPYPAPLSISAPTVVGYANNGESLTTNGGVWSSGDTLWTAYQWQRCDTAGCTDISGGTDSTYTPVTADAGYDLRVRVTATNDHGGAAMITSPINASDYVTSVLASTPVAYWRFGESSGATTAVDLTGHGHDALYTNGFAGFGADGAPVGGADTAAQADSSGTIAAAPYAPTLNSSTFSVEAWVNLSALPGDSAWSRLLSTCDPSGASGFRLEVNTPYHSTPTFAFAVSGGGTGRYIDNSSDPIEANRWYYIAATYDAASGQPNLYVDGQPVSGRDQGTGSYQPVGNSVGTGIGSCTNDPDGFASWPVPFAGTIDEAAIYNRVLTPEEIFEHANSNVSPSAPPTSDQGPEADGEPTDTVDAPTPMTPSGPAVAGSYSTSVMPSVETLAPLSLRAVNSTATGTTGLTGVVIDQMGSTPISGATVTLQSHVCAPSCTDAVTTMTDSQGGYAFLNMPTANYDLTISDATHGTYSVINDPYAADQTYQQTAIVGPTAQSYDMGGGATNTTTATDTPKPPLAAQPHYYSNTMVPPDITVKRYSLWDHDSGGTYCTRIDPNDTSGPVTNYPWPYYVAHVVESEVGLSRYSATGDIAFGSIVQNYGWVHMTFGPGSSPEGPFDIANDTSRQCFIPRHKIPVYVDVSSWTKLLGPMFSRRIVNEQGTLYETPHRAGNSSCSDPEWPVHNKWAMTSQKGLQEHLFNVSCNQDANNWQNLARLYLPTKWKIVPGARPPVPTVTSPVVSGGKVTLTFHTKVQNREMAWKYYIQQFEADNYWRTIQIVGYDSHLRAVPNTWPFDAPTSCTRYRIKAVNPVNDPSVWGSSVLQKTPPMVYKRVGPNGPC